MESLSKKNEKTFFVKRMHPESYQHPSPPCLCNSSLSVSCEMNITVFRSTSEGNTSTFFVFAAYFSVKSSLSQTAILHSKALSAYLFWNVVNWKKQCGLRHVYFLGSMFYATILINKFCESKNSPLSKPASADSYRVFCKNSTFIAAENRCKSTKKTPLSIFP